PGAVGRTARAWRPRRVVGRRRGRQTAGPSPAHRTRFPLPLEGSPPARREREAPLPAGEGTSYRPLVRLMWSAARSAIAWIVEVGFTAALVTNTLPSTT